MAISHARTLQPDVFTGFARILGTAGLRFERRRCWGPMQAIAALFVMRCPAMTYTARSSIPATQELFGAMFGWQRTPVASGLSRARRQVQDADVRTAWKHCQAWAMHHAATVGGHLVPGQTVIAVDGTTLHMPRSASTVRAFPIAKDDLELELHHYPQARLVSAWDVERRIPIAWSMTSMKVGERMGLTRLLPALPERSVLLLDRGFPSREILGHILAGGHDAVMRMVSAKAGSWPEIAAFMASGERSAIIQVAVRQNGTKRLVPMRAVLRAFRRGRPHRGEQRDTMVVLTTITDAGRVSDDAVIDLYHQRWDIETIQREMKTIAALERWHGTTKKLLVQEVHAVMSWFAIAGAIASRLEADAKAVDEAKRDPATPADVLPEPKRVHTPSLFAAVHHVLIWQSAIGHLHPEVVAYLRTSAAIYLDAAHKNRLSCRSADSLTG